LAGKTAKFRAPRYSHAI